MGTTDPGLRQLSNKREGCVDVFKAGGPLIPRDLIDEIIDFLHDDPRMLKSCTLISRSCTATAQRHLFSDVKLDSPTLSLHRRGYPCKKFNDVLCMSPHLGTYVRRLSIVDGYHTSHGRERPRDKHSTCRYAWVAQERTLVEIFARIVNIECLRIEGSRFNLEWWSLLRDIRLTLLAVVSRPHFSKIELVNTVDFMPLLESASWSRALCLRSFSQKALNPAQKTETQRTLEIRSLDIEINGDFMWFIYPFLDLSALHSLTLHEVIHGNEDNVRHLLKSTSRTIEYLQLQFDASTPFECLTDLSQFTHLRSFSINLPWGDVTDQYLIWLVQILYTVPDTACIETIALQLPPRCTDDLSSFGEYTELDKVLLRLAHRRLRSVRAKVAVATKRDSPHLSPLPSKTLRSLVYEFSLREEFPIYHAHLPEVSAKGLLQIIPDEGWNVDRDRVCDYHCDGPPRRRF